MAAHGALESACDQISRMYTHMSDQLDDVTALARRLSSCDELSVPLDDLRRAEAKLQGELATLRQLMQALKRVAEIYRQHEDGIISHCEHLPIGRKVPVWGDSQLDGLVEHMQDIVWK